MAMASHVFEGFKSNIAKIIENTVMAKEEKYNEAVFSSAKRSVDAIDGIPNPEGRKFKDNIRKSNFQLQNQMEEKC
ncbi:hypothetical protein LOK49_LG03G01783 [Camellia lanceoleosa]|uniref:Uncharacterized protein n=1 Tax=Camellia lanceoleosa TaxID=1840588 RepID=A0ACC0IAB3_9ERIC|nr:hypothetical protein LOK49_LG03G01783 [Camellia lanceoleosa]